jgi:hypothetical protein
LRYTPDLNAQAMAALLQKNGISGGRAARGNKAGQAGQGQQQATTAVIWKLDSNKQLVPVQLKLGITDHTTTEVAQVLNGSLNAGDQVITGSATATKTAAGTTAAPGLGGARGGNAGGAMRGVGR